MSMDKLQDKIRKLKNPTMLDLTIIPEHIPVHIYDDTGSIADAYAQFSEALLEALKDTIPAVRFHFNTFAVLGPDGLELLGEVMAKAAQKGYYVLLDAPDNFSRPSTQNMAQRLLAADAMWPCDALTVPVYIGSDGLQPYAELLKNCDKAIFAVLRTANKTAPELQDLLTGGRLVHTAAADMVKRFGEPLLCRCGYSKIGAVGAANAADSLRNLRSKYKDMFLLVDGYDYSNANAKNCSFAFDKLGHGAVVCAGKTITAAWLLEDTNGKHYVQQAVEAAERTKKNLLRYVTVL